MVINLQIHGVAAGLDIRTPTNEDMEILPMYDVTSQFIWDPQDLIHSKN